MKTKILYAFALLISSMAFFSCEQNDEVYSCDPDKDTWVKQNLKEIQKMNRQDWLNTDENLSKAIYAAFTPEQKHDFWTEKITDVLTLNWNERERSHIAKLLVFIEDHKDIFKAGVKDEVEIFAYKWTEYGTQELSWDVDIIYAIAFSGNKMIDKSGNLLKNQSAKIRLKTESESYDCDCRRGSIFTCTALEYCEKDDNCNVVVNDCGFLWMFDCNGICGIK